MKNYPTWICQDCGSKASEGKQYEISCWHEGICDICGKIKSVTEPRDFYYPDFEDSGNTFIHEAYCNYCIFKQGDYKCKYRQWAGGVVDRDRETIWCSVGNKNNNCKFFKARKEEVKKENSIWKYLKSLWKTK